jgi:ABC-type transport system involved in multi-copper enzyme maturation permease subunit
MTNYPLQRQHPIVRRDGFGRAPRMGRARKLLRHRYAPFVILALPIVLVEMVASHVAAYGSMALVIFASGWVNGLLGAWAGGPLVADEFNQQTWDTLATTPIGTGEIVFAKFTASMWRLRHWLSAQLALRGIYLAVGLAAVVTNQDPFGDYYYTGSIWSTDTHAELLPSALALWVIFAAFALAQPILAAAAGASLGILCSTLTRQPALSRGLAIAARIVTWVAAWGITLIIFSECYDAARGVYDFAPQSWWEPLSILVLSGGHIFEFITIVDEFAPNHAGWLGLGLVGTILLAIIPTWAALRLAIAVLRRRRA